MKIRKWGRVLYYNIFRGGAEAARRLVIRLSPLVVPPSVRLTYDETPNTLHKTVFCGTPPAINWSKGVASCIEIFCGARLPADSAFGSPLLSFAPSVCLN